MMNNEKYIKVYDSILSNNELSSSEKLIYSLISSFTQNGDGCFWMSNNEIETRTGISIPTIIKSIKKFESMGMIHIEYENHPGKRAIKKRRIYQTTNESHSNQNTDSVFIRLLLNDNSLHLVTQSDVEHYKELYPAVDVEQELRSMLGWLEANPRRRKTRSGIKAFIAKWLSKTQDQGGVGYGSYQGSNVKNSVPGESRETYRTGEKVF